MNGQLFKVSSAQAKTLEMLPSSLLDGMTNLQALTTSVTLSGGTHESLANGIGKPRETLTRFLNGHGGLNFFELMRLINETGNLVILQYMAHEFGYELTAIDQKAKRKAELLAELAEIERAA